VGDLDQIIGPRSNQSGSVAPRVEPKATFVKDEYLLVSLPREAGSPILHPMHPFRVGIDDAIELHHKLGEALEKAGYGPSKA
jgi:hypothetical protein